MTVTEVCGFSGIQKAAMGQHSTLSLSFNDANFNDNSNFNPPPTPSTKFPWNKKKTKTSLSNPDIQQAHTAAPWILNVIEFSHWLYALPTMVTVYSLIDNLPFWTGYLNQNSFQLFLWIMAPVVGGVMATIPVLLECMYDDWQVAPTRDDTAFEEYNNAYLQTIALNFMFTMLTIEDVMYYHGYFGINQFLPLSLAAVGYACLCDKNETIGNFAPHASFPGLTIGVIAGQGVGYVLKGLVYFNLASHVDLLQHPLVPASLFLGMLLDMAGGVYQGAVLEKTYNQWDHLVAAMILAAGVSLQAVAFLKLPHCIV